MADHPGAPATLLSLVTRLRDHRRSAHSHLVGRLSRPHELYAVRQTAGNPADANIMLLICTVADLPALHPAAAHNAGRGAVIWPLAGPLSSPGMAYWMVAYFVYLYIAILGANVRICRWERDEMVTRMDTGPDL